MEVGVENEANVECMGKGEMGGGVESVVTW